MSDSTQKAVKVSQEIITHALEAKSFIRESGEGDVPDELLMRASVAFNMLQRRGMITEVRTDDGDCKPHKFDAFDRAHAIALIGHNFQVDPEDTPERATLFSTRLDLHTLAGRLVTAVSPPVQTSKSRSERWYSKAPPENDNGSACVLTGHRTKDAAERAAAEVLEDGSEGWPEDVTSVEWGILVPIAKAAECNRTVDPSGEFDYICQYRLANIPPLISDIRASGPLNAGEQAEAGRLAGEVIGLIAAGICPSMVDVETLARLAARAAESGAV